MDTLGRREDGKRLDDADADADRSESDGSDTIDDADFAGLLISRLKSRYPLASLSENAGLFNGLVAENEREVCKVRFGGETGL